MSRDANASALRTLLRSLGQIVLQAHAGTGACVLAALALTDWRLACAALLGATAANVCAQVNGHAGAAIREGRAGFNGALAGLAAQSVMGDASTAAAVALIAGGASAWIAPLLERPLARARLALYSTPCLIVTWLWLPMRANVAADAAFVADFVHKHAALNPIASVLGGLAQTVFATGAAPGACVLAGLALSSRRAASFALCGATFATALEFACGAPYADLDAGLAGFNGALAALATHTLGARAAFCATMLAAALHRLAAHYGLPALTAPFVLASWSAHLAARRWRGHASAAH
ncbi:urea transporter [Paraburkholderia acidisoli]|uniref:Urea transporter n=1 Tax=Paraburkholderia acidisoli TaxID=2571748 RepID=A0A7Z2JIB5_9BURK|nr:urea transporter [Paraburkholderia acidisoli]QGZ64145.1 urea transporter [Paraburkholderia acidisoli]